MGRIVQTTVQEYYKAFLEGLSVPMTINGRTVSGFFYLKRFYYIDQQGFKKYEPEGGLRVELLTTAQAAKYLGISYSLLARMRRRGEGPRYVKLSVNGSIRYSKEVLDEYIKERTVSRPSNSSLNSAS